MEAFEGNAAETTTTLPSIQAFMAAHQLADITVVADAGMISDVAVHGRGWIRGPGVETRAFPGLDEARNERVWSPWHQPDATAD